MDLGMRLVFMGTPDFAVDSLQALVEAGYEVLGVFTQPDRPAGRGGKISPPPVKTAAEALGLSVCQPEKIGTQEVFTQISSLNPEVIVVVAYGKILTREILGIPKRGCINVHASLLPMYRGAAPIHWAVMNGETRSGISTMLMDEGLDTGDILLKKEVEITSQTTTGELHDQLAALGGELLVETLRQMEDGKLSPVPQRGETVYAPMLKREHERIDWSRRAVELDCQIRGLHPWPGAFTEFKGEPLKIRSAALGQLPGTPGEVLQDEKENDSHPKSFVPGQILRILKDGLEVQTGDGILIVKQVQPAGKRAMPAKDFYLGRRGSADEGFT